MINLSVCYAADILKSIKQVSGTDIRFKLVEIFSFHILLLLGSDPRHSIVPFVSVVLANDSLVAPGGGGRFQISCPYRRVTSLPPSP